jgi:PAS domain S-box-containing protein
MIKTDPSCIADEHILNAISDPIVIISKDYKILKANKAFLEQNRRKENDLIGRTCYEVIHHFDAPCLPNDHPCPMKEALCNNGQTLVEYTRSGPQGIFYQEVSAYPVKDQKGEVLYFIHYSRDITKRKKLDQELAASELKYKTIFESSKDAIMLLTPEKGFFRGNPATIKMFACDNEEDFDNQAPSSLSPEYQPDGELSSVKAQEMMALAMKKGSHYFEWTHKRKNGEEFPTTVLLTKTKLGDRFILQATVRDISEQKKVKKLVGVHEKRLIFAIETARLGLWEIDLIKNTVWRSPYHDRLFGYEKPLPQWTHQTFLSHIVPEHRDDIEETYLEAINEKENWDFECKIKRKDGKIRWIWCRTNDLRRERKTSKDAGPNPGHNR